jgi:hypothetical protein
MTCGYSADQNIKLQFSKMGWETTADRPKKTIPSDQKLLWTKKFWNKSQTIIV